jgi:hypothetical protein
VRFWGKKTRFLKPKPRTKSERELNHATGSKKGVLYLFRMARISYNNKRLTLRFEKSRRNAVVKIHLLQLLTILSRADAIVNCVTSQDIILAHV